MTYSLPSARLVRLLPALSPYLPPTPPHPLQEGGTFTAAIPDCERCEIRPFVPHLGADRCASRRLVSPPTPSRARPCRHTLPCPIDDSPTHVPIAHRAFPGIPTPCSRRARRRSLEVSRPPSLRGSVGQRNSTDRVFFRDRQPCPCLPCLVRRLGCHFPLPSDAQHWPWVRPLSPLCRLGRSLSLVFLPALAFLARPRPVAIMPCPIAFFVCCPAPSPSPHARVEAGNLH